MYRGERKIVGAVFEAMATAAKTDVGRQDECFGRGGRLAMAEATT